MKLVSLASHFPNQSFTQAECLEEMRNAPFWKNLKDRSKQLLEKVLDSDSGIKKRHFEINDLNEVWERSAEELNKHYETSAPSIGANAVKKALAEANLDPLDIDVLLVSSCTGYLCPGISSYIAEQLGCRANIHTQDVTGHGCGAAIPLTQIAHGYSKLMPSAHIVTLSVEVCSAAFYISDEPDVLISACLFGDGAAAAIWNSSSGDYEAYGYQSLLNPQEREKIRFVNSGGKLKNQLHRSVPDMTAKAVKELYSNSKNPAKIITHGGGRDVIIAIEKELGISEMKETRSVLANYGNLSSPSVMVALEEYLKSGGEENEIWLSSFGAGFSAHSMKLRKSR